MGTPAAIASSSTMPNDSWPVAGDTNTSAVASARILSWSLTRPSSSTPCSRRVAM